MNVGIYVGGGGCILLDFDHCPGLNQGNICQKKKDGTTEHNSLKCFVSVHDDILIVILFLFCDSKRVDELLVEKP